MHRVKKVEYEDDDLYSGEEEEADAEYTAEDRDNFATLTPVVRAELEEARLHASDREIEEALWHYYWDVSKSVAYLKNTRTPRPAQRTEKKEQPKSKFDQAVQKSAEKAGEWQFSLLHMPAHGLGQACSLQHRASQRGAFMLYDRADPERLTDMHVYRLVSRNSLVGSTSCAAWPHCTL